LFMPCPATAQGGFNIPGRYEISNVKSGKVLDLDRNDQTSVIQYSARGTDNQVWEIQAIGGGYYSFRNGMNGNALEAAGDRNSTPLRATRFDGRSGQQWRIDAGKDGSALIVSRLGKTIDIPDGAARDGVPAQIYERNGDSNQQFRFRLLNASRGGGSRRNDRLDSRPNNRTPPPVYNNPGNPTSLTGTGTRTELKPGWNMFSAEQDVELGKQAATEVTQQVPMLNDSRVDNYVNSLGQRLSALAPGFRFTYTFKTVNDRSVNAFALPGGNVFINRGLIEAADNESQLAGVMAHEIAHVALRHGTNQASKASAAQMPLAILGGVLGSNSTGAALAQLGAGFTVNSILLKYSRDAESQADVMGTQMLFDAGIDPRAMGQFFAKLGGGSGAAFFNSHPNPDRRIEATDEEAARLGTQRTSQASSREFAEIKRYLQSLPTPRANQLQSQQQQSAPGRPAATSQRLLGFENAVLRMDHPDNWRAYGQGDAATFAPEGGLVKDVNGNQALAYGVVVNIYEPASDRYGQRLQGPGFRPSSAEFLDQATDQLVATLQQSNRNMRVVRRHGSIDVNGERGISTYLSNDSPIQGGGRETNWLVTLPRTNDLLFIVFTAPEREFQSYENAFQQMLYSVRIKR
ncbi:MAG: M48 family metalloprotease, partial [Bryobacterales bacterium]|nr:M48 family metalloprotease [Bryobacterales bacterium]